MEHRFTGPSYTLGIEEELMIVDAETLALSSAIEQLLTEGEDRIKPELMESVCEIATMACRDVDEAGAELTELRRQVCHRADDNEQRGASNSDRLDRRDPHKPQRPTMTMMLSEHGPGPRRWRRPGGHSARGGRRGRRSRLQR